MCFHIWLTSTRSHVPLKTCCWLFSNPVHLEPSGHGSQHFCNSGKIQKFGISLKIILKPPEFGRIWIELTWLCFCMHVLCVCQIIQVTFQSNVGWRAYFSVKTNGWREFFELSAIAKLLFYPTCLTHGCRSYQSHSFQV